MTAALELGRRCARRFAPLVLIMLTGFSVICSPFASVFVMPNGLMHSGRQVKSCMNFWGPRKEWSERCTDYEWWLKERRVPSYRSNRTVKESSLTGWYVRQIFLARRDQLSSDKLDQLRKLEDSRSEKKEQEGNAAWLAWHRHYTSWLLENHRVPVRCRGEERTTEDIEESTLARWFERQCKFEQDGTLSSKQLALLEELRDLGAKEKKHVWSKWHASYKSWLLYYERLPSCSSPFSDAPDEERALEKWYFSQRRAAIRAKSGKVVRKGELDSDQLAQLLELQQLREEVRLGVNDLEAWLERYAVYKNWILEKDRVPSSRSDAAPEEEIALGKWYRYQSFAKKRHSVEQQALLSELEELRNMVRSRFSIVDRWRKNPDVSEGFPEAYRP